MFLRQWAAGAGGGTGNAPDDAPYLTNGSNATLTNEVDVTALGAAGLTFTSSVVNGGTPTLLTLSPGAHTACVASTEVIDVNFNLARTVEFATGALTTQRAVVIAAPTYAFVGASTISQASTLHVNGAPSTGANATITDSTALRVTGTATIATAAGIVPLGFQIVAYTLTLTGTTQVTSTGPAAVRIGRLTVTDTDVVTVNNASSLYINNSPLQAGSVTITNSYSIWVDNGNCRFDGTLGVGGSPTAATQLTVTQAVSTTGSPTALLVTGGAHTTLAASAEAIDVNFNLARTVQFATGALTTQRAVVIAAPTYGFVAASTISDAATVEISGAPVAGTNATITRRSALWAQGNVRVGAGLDTPAVASTTYLSVQGTGVNQVGARNTSVGVEASIHVEGDNNTASVGTRTNSPFSLAANNSNKWTVQAGGYLVAATGAEHIQTGGGTALLPGYAFGNNSTTGLFSTNAQQNIGFSTNGVERANLSNLGNWTLTQGISTTGSPVLFTVTGAAHTTLAASTEAIDVYLSLARTVQFATGALTTQRAVVIAAPTYGFVGASTVTNAVTVQITAAPAAGTNATFTNVTALTVGGAASIGPTSAGMLYSAINVPSHTVTVTGTTQVTSVGPSALSLAIVTVTDASAVTIDTAATLYIAGAVAQAGSATITNTYALWIDAGASRFDGVITQITNAIGTAATPGCSLVNTTDAANGAQQYSPGLVFTGEGWKTNATAESQPVDWMIQCRPSQGAAAPLSVLSFLSQVNGGGYVQRAYVQDNGNIYATQQVRGDASGAALYAPNGGAQVLAATGYDATAAAALKIGASTASGVWLGKSGGNIGFYGTAPTAQGAAIADASGGAVIDAEARTALNALLASTRLQGLIAT